jgi:hypothetical protein
VCVDWSPSHGFALIVSLQVHPHFSEHIVGQVSGYWLEVEHWSSFAKR